MVWPCHDCNNVLPQCTCKCPLCGMVGYGTCVCGETRCTSCGCCNCVCGEDQCNSCGSYNCCTCVQDKCWRCRTFERDVCLCRLHPPMPVSITARLCRDCQQYECTCCTPPSSITPHSGPVPHMPPTPTPPCGPPCMSPRTPLQHHAGDDQVSPGMSPRTPLQRPAGDDQVCSRMDVDDDGRDDGSCSSDSFNHMEEPNSYRFACPPYAPALPYAPYPP